MTDLFGLIDFLASLVLEDGMNLDTIAERMAIFVTKTPRFAQGLDYYFSISLPNRAISLNPRLRNSQHASPLGNKLCQ